MPQIDTKEALSADVAKKLKKPRKYAVIFHNNDYTPFDFVQMLIIEVFKKTTEEAHSITLAIHQKSKAAVGIYPYEIAEAKLVICKNLCTVHNCPIKITMEPV